MFWYVYQSTNGPNHGTVLKIQSFLLNGICTVILLAGLLRERQFEKVLLKYGCGKVPNWECLFVNREKRTIFVCIRGRVKTGWKETKYQSDVENHHERRWCWENQHHSLTMFIWVVLNENVKLAKILWTITKTCSNPGFLLGSVEKLSETRASGKLDANTISSWSHDMEGHAKKCVERNCELALKTTDQLNKVATPCLDDQQFQEEEMGSVGDVSTVCSHFVLKCMYLGRIGRPDILWSVNKLAGQSQTGDKRLARLTSYIHHKCEFRQYCYVGNTAQKILLCGKHSTTMQIWFNSLFFAGDLEESKSTSGGLLCIFGSQTFVPITWKCKKQTSVSHSSTEAEIISLDAVFTHGWNSRSWSLGLCDWSISFLTKPS